MRNKTSQELFWEGQFGQEYTERNDVDARDRLPFFKTVIERTYGVNSILEVGANRGHNLRAIRLLSNNYKLCGIDVNQQAVAELSKTKDVHAMQSSIQDYDPGQQFDLVFSCGVLIHLCPEDLPHVYKKLFQLSARYILINEYFNPTPVELNYRGHDGRLFKRDFASELIENNDGKLAVVDYGFLWKRVSPSWDDTTWFLLEKTP